MKDGQIQAERLIADLIDLLHTLPGVEARVQALAPELSGARYHALIEASFSGLAFELWVEAKTEVFPRDAREHLSRWLRAKQAQVEHPRMHLLMAAQTISRGARVLLASGGVGYFDRGGSLCLPFPGAYALIDKPAEKKPGQRFELFTEARKPVLQAMLLAPELAYTVHDLADNTGSSSATVSKLMAYLEREDWVTAEGRGPFKRRKLSKPGAVLDAWVAAETRRLPRRRARRFFVRGHKATDLPRLLTNAAPTESAGPAHHFTAEAAAHRYAPFLTTWSVTTMRAAPHRTEQFLESIEATEVQQGYNLLIVEDGLSALRFSSAIDQITVASPIQTYVDLMCTPGRAPDAAKHLREQILKF